MAKRRKKKKAKKWISWIIIFFIIALIFSGSFYFYQKKQAEKNRPPEFQKVSIEKMEDTLNSSPKEAKKYIGKKVEVTGVIFMTNKEDQYFVISKNKNDYICGIQGNMKDGELINEMADVKIGDEITIKGKITSAQKFLGYEMNVSHIEKSETGGVNAKESPAKNKVVHEND